ncbi:MAG: hypothetical protein Q9219_001119 [cf. Caloplaca sp. 3 TL-2023]
MAQSTPELGAPSPDGPPKDVIYNLVVCTKANHTVDALQKVAHRLTRESSILFIQNGMGIIEEVNDKVFLDATQRPQYLLGVLSHGVYRIRPFHLVHSGYGTTALTILPRNNKDGDQKFESSALYLLRTITGTPELAAVGFGPTELLQLQIEKLVINAVINPLTALLGCVNGDLLHHPSISRVIRLLLAEICLVIKALPELQGIPNVTTRFHIKRLESQVIGVASRTAANRSSTLQDISEGKPTEIDYINGYFIRRGEELGIQCLLNYMLMHVLKTKDFLEGERHGNLVPLELRGAV